MKFNLVDYFNFAMSLKVLIVPPNNMLRLSEPSLDNKTLAFLRVVDLLTTMFTRLRCNFEVHTSNAAIK